MSLKFKWGPTAGQLPLAPVKKAGFWIVLCSLVLIYLIGLASYMTYRRMTGQALFSTGSSRNVATGLNVVDTAKVAPPVTAGSTVIIDIGLMPVRTDVVTTCQMHGERMTVSPIVDTAYEEYCNGKFFRTIPKRGQSAPVPDHDDSRIDTLGYRLVSGQGVDGIEFVYIRYLGDLPKDWFAMGLRAGRKARL